MDSIVLPKIHFPKGLAGPDPDDAAKREYRFVETPAGVYFGVSFASESVRTGQGVSIDSLEEKWRRIFASSEERCAVQDPVRLNAATPIEWQDYETLESGLDAILAREDRSVGDCLIAGHVWLGMLTHVLRATQGTSANPSPSETIRHYAHRTAQDGYARAFDIAARSAANPVVKRMILGTLIGFRRTLSPRQWRFVTVAWAIGANVRHWMRLGSLRFPELEEKIAWRDFVPDPEILLSPDAQPLLRRYFRHVLFRKDLVLQTDFLLGYCFSILMHGVIEWYATVLRRLDNPDPVGAALGIVEGRFVLDPAFGPLFLHHPAIGEALYRLTRRPNFAHTMIKG